MASATRACSRALRASSRVAAPAASKSSLVAATSWSPVLITRARWASPAGAAAAPRFYSAKTNDTYHEISATGSKLWNYDQVRKATKDPYSGVVFVDAREPGELEQTGRIPSAINIPVVTAPESFHISDTDFKDRYGFTRPGKEKELVFYCKAGVRSRALAALAREAGWKNVGEYPGSWLDWQKNDGEVEKGGNVPSQD